MDSGVLPSDTTRELVSAAQSGTETARPALDRLLDVNEGLCRQIVLAVQHGQLPLDDDLMQVARIAFVRAVENFRPGTATLSTYASARMRGAVLDEVRKRSRESTRLPIANSEGRAQPEDGAEKKRAPEPVLDLLAARLQRLVLQSALKALPASDRDLLIRLYDQDRSQSAVASDLGVSHTTIHKRHRRILNDLRYAMST